MAEQGLENTAYRTTGTEDKDIQTRQAQLMIVQQIVDQADAIGIVAKTDACAEIEGIHRPGKLGPGAALLGQ